MTPPPPSRSSGPGGCSALETAGHSCIRQCVSCRVLETMSPRPCPGGPWCWPACGGSISPAAEGWAMLLTSRHLLSQGGDGPSRPPAGWGGAGGEQGTWEGSLHVVPWPPSPSLAPWSMSAMRAAGESPPLRMSEGTELLTCWKPRLRGSGRTPGWPSYWTEVLLGSGALRETGVWDPGLPVSTLGPPKQSCTAVWLREHLSPTTLEAEVGDQGPGPPRVEGGSPPASPLTRTRIPHTQLTAATSCYLNHPLNGPSPNRVPF